MCEFAKVVIEGHTDSAGSAEYNQGLSEARAAAERRYLASREGLPAAVIESHGYGKSRPIASNDVEEGRQKNRRVEIIVTPEGK